MSRRAHRWVLGLAFFALLPVPFMMVSNGFAPPLRVLFLASVLGAIAVVDGAQGPMRIAACSSSEGEFSFTLPPGEYYFWAYGRDLQNYTNQSMMLSADQGEVNLGAIDIQPSIIAQHYGKAPPKWNVTDARGAKVGVQPSDYKGKWLLLEFWGYW